MFASDSDSLEFKSIKKITKQNIPKRHILLPQKKSNKRAMVLFGHENWNLVVNMMMGIQMAVKSVSIICENELTNKDF